MRLDWTAPTDNGGSVIDGYLVRIWANSVRIGAYTDFSLSNVLTYTPTGLIPGQAYCIDVRAHNGSYNGYSPAAGVTNVSTIPAVWVNVGGVWKRAAVWVNVLGTWKYAKPWVNVGGIWKVTV
jgi:hypothetical protein